MALKPDDFDFLSNLSTLWAIILGSILATGGGLVGNQIERIIERRQRERDAALLFAEILSSLKILIDFAQRTRGIGDPYGPITMRMMRAARRELDMYERNREQLYALSDHMMRGRIHRAMLQLTMPIDGLFDASNGLDILTAQLKTPSLPAEEREELERRMENIRTARDQGFDFINEASEQLKAIVKDLEPVSGQSFDRVAAATAASA